MLYKFINLISFFICMNLFYLQAETRREIKIGISFSDYLPEFQDRYYRDDLIAGGSDGIGFGAINRKYSQKYYPAIFNPIDFKYYYTKDNYNFSIGLESLGNRSFNVSQLKSSYDYSATGFFKGQGDLDSKMSNTNSRISIGKKINSIWISGLILKRDFQSEYEKNDTLYAPGFLGLVHAESNFSSMNLFVGTSITKMFEKGRVICEVSFRSRNYGLLSSSGKIEQFGVIRFPFDILTGNLSSDLLVTNYLYGDKKPNIYGMRILVDYQYPIFENVFLSVSLDYDRLYVSYERYLPSAFFRFNNSSGISKPELAFSEILSSYIIYRDPILSEIKSLRLGAVLFF